ncbi:amidohydrolase [Biformimicrobium ophioploci]|uniref:Amidohydrolase family protein n=1 Tax=Biformimicrobium ophioploci TaxID=3036711 RepID=A0ABQ6M106_9GAMM|nr:amidohydrolase family protein [Microbulbifer sp. NKW57]GMG88019.1 amidohydrolase family protein [Microbulbifer sp. NKW57]
MKRLLSLAALVGALSGCSDTQPSSTQIFYGGTIYTANAQQEMVEAMAIAGDSIVFAGTVDQAKKRYPDNAEWIDLEGKFLMPGIHDAHIHPSLALEGETCQLPQQNSLDLANIVREVQQCLSELGSDSPARGEWITVSQFNGYGADSPQFLGDYPDIATGLDEISTRHKIILIGIDGHAHAVNHYALEHGATLRGESVTLTSELLAGELSAYQALVPLNAQGLPTGQLKSQAAWDLFKYESRSVDGFLAIHESFNNYFLSNGITAFTEAWTRERDLEIYEGLIRNGHLAPRVTMAYALAKDKHLDSAGMVNLEKFFQDLNAARKRFENYPRANISAVKVFVDGVMEYPTQTAALTKPYLEAEISDSGNVHYPNDTSHNRGKLELTPSELNRLVTAVDAAGLAMYFHAIGDQAVSVALDAVEQARSASGSDIPHNISHLQLVGEEDVERFGELGVFATPSPAWFTPWYDYDLSVIPYIDNVDNIKNLDELYRPESRYMQAVYPVESIRKHGATISFGSDAPVDFNGPRPFTNIMSALLRADWVEPDSTPPRWTVLNAEERMTIYDILDAYTINSAAAMRHDHLTGSLEAGKRADFIILNNDLVALAAGVGKTVNADGEQVAYSMCDKNYDASYCTTEVLQTYIDGELVYSAE